MDPIEKAAQKIVQRTGFILWAPSSFTSDVAMDGMEWPLDFAKVADLIAERLERQARGYREQAKEWRKEG